MKGCVFFRWRSPASPQLFSQHPSGEQVSWHVWRDEPSSFTRAAQKDSCNSFPLFFLVTVKITRSPIISEFHSVCNFLTPFTFALSFLTHAHFNLGLRFSHCYRLWGKQTIDYQQSICVLSKHEYFSTIRSHCASTICGKWKNKKKQTKDRNS